MKFLKFSFLALGPIDWYKVSNAGKTTWRPAIKELKFYSDVACKTQVDILGTNVECSGHNPPSSNACGKAVDGSAGTSWRPQCQPCHKGDARIAVPLPRDTAVKCIVADNLGKGSGGNNNWNTGLIIGRSEDKVTWKEVAVSNSENFIKLEDGTSRSGK